jgi:hypothetical protein
MCKSLNIDHKEHKIMAEKSTQVSTTTGSQLTNTPAEGIILTDNSTESMMDLKQPASNLLDADSEKVIKKARLQELKVKISAITSREDDDHLLAGYAEEIDRDKLYLAGGFKSTKEFMQQDEIQVTPGRLSQLDKLRSQRYVLTKCGYADFELMKRESQSRGVPFRGHSPQAQEITDWIEAGYDEVDLWKDQNKGLCVFWDKVISATNLAVEKGFMTGFQITTSTISAVASAGKNKPTEDERKRLTQRNKTRKGFADAVNATYSGKSVDENKLMESMEDLFHQAPASVKSGMVNLVKTNIGSIPSPVLIDLLYCLVGNMDAFPVESVGPVIAGKLQNNPRSLEWLIEILTAKQQQAAA